MTTIRSEGARIANDLNAYIPQDYRIRPLRDRIVVEPLPWRPSKIIEVVSHAKPLRGIVRAVGPGTYPVRYNGPKGRRTKSWDSKAFRPCDVKVGDIVELGGLEIEGYLHKTFLWGNKQMILCQEGDIAGIECQ
jgi:co-chaperonin GroES (HSP10)